MNAPKLVDVANARHSSASNEHYTPPQIVEAARAAMGSIDLDPASCALANEVVRACNWYGNYGVGTLRDAWVTSTQTKDIKVFLNPPGGLLVRATFEPVSERATGRKGVSVQDCVSAQAVWWAKLVHEWHIGNVEQAVFVCFNLEVLRLTQKPIAPFTGHTPPASLPICFLKDRPQYWNEATPVDKRGRSGAPTHAGAVVYLPSHAELTPWARHTGEDAQPGCARFERFFAALGLVRI